MRARKILLDSLAAAMADEWVDKNRKPFVSGDTAYVPVRTGYPADTQLDERRPYRGRGYQMIGDIAVFHGERPDDSDLKGLIEWKNPRAVLYIKNYREIMRLPEAETLYGESCDVLHREEGYTFRLDPSKVMFAQGNREEKKRMAEYVGMAPAGERVADMFAGIGYFTIPMAKAGAFVHAMEINPVSFGYLEENIAGNCVGENVTTENGDCRDLLKGEYDRAVMGHFDAPSMLGDILPHMKSGGTIHLHAIDGGTGDGNDKIIDAAGEYGFSATVTLRRVKKYSPGSWHTVQDVRLE
ncbi:class I SAM-dependent methyltransferase [Methanolacinia petrolearia]|uniref:class I SAM-dependent methyltransferase n=1 Tax=Methanolacinia petrolearia TaxID=54120 RepID=UPI003BAC706F